MEHCLLNPGHDTMMQFRSNRNVSSELNVLPDNRTAAMTENQLYGYGYADYGSEEYNQYAQADGDAYEANYETYDQPGLVPHRSILRDIFEILLLIITIYTLVNLATARAV